MLSSLCCSLRRCAISNHQLLQNINKAATLGGLQQQQTIFTLRRKYPVPATKLHKSGKIDRKVKQRFKIYIPDGRIRPKKLLKLILTEDVEDLGVRGDVVVVPKKQGRSELLRYNKAVYASPENIEEFAKRDDGRDLPLTISATLKYLQDKRLQVDVRCLESEPHWEELSYPKARIINAFKNKLGVIVSEDAIKLPEEPIKDYGTYTIQLTINGTETIPVEVDVVNEEIALESNSEVEAAQ